MAAAVHSAPEAFGGKRGGGKTRADGLRPGSEEAKTADRAKDAARKAQARAAAKAASLPAPLPSAAPAAAGGAAVAAPEFPLEPGGGVASDAAPVAGVTGALVAWSGRVLTRPWKLAVKIMARLRVAGRRKQIEATPLPESVKAEICKSLDFAEESKAQLAEALANATAIELNKRGVGGAQNSHLIDVGICLADVVNQDLELSEKITQAVATYLVAQEKDRPKTADHGPKTDPKPG